MTEPTVIVEIEVSQDDIDWLHNLALEQIFYRKPYDGALLRVTSSVRDAASPVKEPGTW